MSASTPTALVAAPPTLFREGLLDLLRKQWPLLHLTLTADATQLDDLLTQCAYELIVFDGALPGLALPALLSRLHRTRPSQRLLVLADPRTLPPPQEAAPAWGSTQLLMPSQVLPHALAAALAPWLDAPITTEMPPARRNPSYTIANGFSRRELEVLRLVVADYCNEEIANQLFINVRTVETHRRNLLQKAGTRTVVGLAARAVREGWVA